MICAKCGNRDHDLQAKACRVCGSKLDAPKSRANARTSSHYQDVTTWQRHIVQRLGAPPVEIKQGETFVFGRSSESDMKINSPKISRKHAQVEWEEATPVLVDLGSENGTEVNGKPIKRHPLEDGDEIEIGPFGCTYRCLQGRSSVQMSQELNDSKADTQSMNAVAMSGSLSEMGVYELLETLSYNQKTGTLDVYTEKGAEGTVALQEGLPLYAAASHLVGEPAIHHMLGWTEGQYRFVATVDPDLAPNVWTTIQALLTQAQQQAKRAQAKGQSSGKATGPHKTPPKASPPSAKRRRPPPSGKGRRRPPG
jgi:pSer/pThr/pTyr-binding forkhead associated (FHA) protein